MRALELAGVPPPLDRPRAPGYWYDPTDPDAFHTPEEVDDHIERRDLNNYVSTLRERPDIHGRFMRRLAEHPEERSQWQHVLDAFAQAEKNVAL